MWGGMGAHWDGLWVWGRCGLEVCGARAGNIYQIHVSAGEVGF